METRSRTKVLRSITNQGQVDPDLMPLKGSSRYSNFELECEQAFLLAPCRRDYALGGGRSGVREYEAGATSAKAMRVTGDDTVAAS